MSALTSLVLTLALAGQAGAPAVVNDGPAIPNGTSLLVGGTFLTVSATAYCNYIGRTFRETTIDYVRFHVTTAGAGAQTAEVGIYTTPAGPKRAGQTLTRVAATGTLSALTATGVKENSAALGAVVPSDSHTWACARFAMATTQPTIVGLARDMSDGAILRTTSAAALTSAATLAGAVVALSTATTAPELRVYRP